MTKKDIPSLNSIESGMTMDKLSNEFAYVRFGKVKVGNGERLLIEVPSSGKRVLLDPVLLDTIASLGHEELSRLLVIVRE